MRKPTTKRSTRTSVRREDLSKVTGGLTLAELRSQFLNPGGFAPDDPTDPVQDKPKFSRSSGLFG